MPNGSHGHVLSLCLFFLNPEKERFLPSEINIQTSSAEGTALWTNMIILPL